MVGAKFRKNIDVVLCKALGGSTFGVGVVSSGISTFSGDFFPESSSPSSGSSFSPSSFELCNC